MGRESDIQRDRDCNVCQRTWYMSARELQEHSAICARAQQAGLILPGNVSLVEDHGRLVIR